MNRAYEIMFRKHVAYRRCFLNDAGELTPDAKIVLQDFAKFAGMGDTPTVVSPVSRQTDVPATMQRIGRSDVVNRVWKFLRLPINKMAEVINEGEE